MSNSAAAEEITLYVLKLRNGRYYVGSTNNLDRRYAEHLGGKGSAWTKRHTPVSIEYHVRGNRFGEDSLVLEYMNRHGIDNVRGGTYSKCELEDSERATIDRHLRHAGNQCFKCGGRDHFAEQCRKRVRLDCARCGRSSHTQEKCFATTHKRGHSLSRSPKRRNCLKCGRDSHEAAGCYASTHVNGSPIRESSVKGQSRGGNGRSGSGQTCFRCGRNGHMVESCFASTSAHERPLEDSEDSEDSVSVDDQRRGGNVRSGSGQTCFRCGRSSHMIESCYASTNADGRRLEDSGDESSEDDDDFDDGDY